MAAETHFLWAALLKMRYCDSLGFFRSKPKTTDSGGWKDIMSTREVIRQNSCFLVGDGPGFLSWNQIGLKETSL